MEVYALKNLNKKTNVAPGIATYALIALKSDFTTIAGIAVPTADTPLGDKVKIKTAHVFKAGKAWAKWSLAIDKNEFDSTAEGDKGFRQFKQTAKIFVPGSYAEAHATMADLLNEEMIVIVKDINCSASMYYQMGNECNGATMNPNFKTATSAGGVKGHEVTIEYSGPCVQIYEASIGTILSDDAGVPVSMDFSANTTVAQAGVSVVVPSADADIDFEFSTVSGPYATTAVMILKVGVTTEATVTFSVLYLGKPFTFTDATGAEHTGYFQAGTLTY